MNKRHDKREVLQIGMHLFHQKGFHNVGLAEICSTTQMQKGNFYHAFKSKEEFFLQSLVLFGDRQCSYIQKGLAKTEKNAFDQLKKFFLQMLEYGPENNYSGCMINNTMNELGAQNPKINDINQIQFKRLVQNIQPCVQQAQLQKDLKKIGSAEDMTTLILLSIYGILTQFKASKNLDKSKHQVELLFENLKNPQP